MRTRSERTGCVLDLFIVELSWRGDHSLMAANGDTVSGVCLSKMCFEADTVRMNSDT